MTDFRVGVGYDSHRLQEDLPLFIGGVKIQHHKGCIAHSDGDVLIHALCDALFGAAGLQDIGTHFPDNDSLYKNADSKSLLTKTVTIVTQLGWQINNVDCTVIIEKPKLAPHTLSMKNVLSSILNIANDSISIKAKSDEKMGCIGREEGVRAIVVATLKK